MAEITVERFNQIIRDELPLADEMGMLADSISHGKAILRLPFKDNMIRPGGTIAGPFMMALADVAMYAVALSVIGEVQLAVTTSFNINFLHRPLPADLIAQGKVLKAGKRLVVSEVEVHSEGNKEAVAHTTGTYSIPPRA